jgi:hypothetical protein
MNVACLSYQDATTRFSVRRHGVLCERKQDMLVASNSNRAQDTAKKPALKSFSCSRFAAAPR